MIMNGLYQVASPMGFVKAFTDGYGVVIKAPEHEVIVIPIDGEVYALAIKYTDVILLGEHRIQIQKMPSTMDIQSVYNQYRNCDTWLINKLMYDELLTLLIGG